MVMDTHPNMCDNCKEVSDQVFQRTCEDRWSLRDFDIGSALGRGKYGVVYEATVKQTKQKVALKVLDKEQLERDSMILQVKQEVEIHSRLNHPNILKLYGYFYDPKRIYLVLEFACGGELYQAMKKQPAMKFSEPVASRYIAQLASALAYCHGFNIIHRDVKPENLLLSGDGVLKLADFGWAAHDRNGYNGYQTTSQFGENIPPHRVNLGSRRTTICGTLDYLAPEVVKGKAYDETVDNWTLGVLAYELVVGAPPFEPINEPLEYSPFSTPHLHESTPSSVQSDNEATFKKIRALDYKFPSEVSSDVRDLIKRLLHIHAERRLGLLEVLCHPWITKNDDSL